MDTLGPANFGIISLLYRGCLLSELILYCHGPVGTTQLVLYTERSTVLCPLFKGSFERGSIVLSLLNSSIILSNKTITFEMMTALLRITLVVTIHTAHLPIVYSPIGSDYPIYQCFTFPKIWDAVQLKDNVALACAVALACSHSVIQLD